MDAPRTLVVIFLRGGLDGLHAVAPVGDDDYRRARPTLAVDAPKPGRAGAQAVRLDDRFCLAPELAALEPLWAEGRMSIVHAIGSDDTTRSHFDAQDLVEHGATESSSARGGWIARWLRTEGAAGALSALAFGTAVPEALRGAPSAVAVDRLEDLGLRTRSGSEAAFADALRGLHAMRSAAPADPAPDDPTAPVRRGAAGALAVLDRLAGLRTGTSGSDAFPRTDLGRSLAQTARLVRENLGLRVVCMDHGGFDTHVVQSQGIPGRLSEFAEGLAAFDRALGEGGDRDRVTTLCVTEFGRRLVENNSYGTDHGRAGVAFALGGGGRGGRVLGTWPGLAEDRLEDGLDLAVTTDYRDLIWEALAARFGARDPAPVFPGLRPQAPGAFEV